MAVYAGRLAPIPGGRISMRDARTNGERIVQLEPFAMSSTTVSSADYRAPSDAPHNSAPPRVPSHPVTWFAAVKWCNAASAEVGLPAAYSMAGRTVVWHTTSTGYRLPTEAEWEWACRAGTSTPTYGPLADIAWTAADEVQEPHEVALKAPNAFGLHDTIGNVWEWCWDYADTARYGDYRALRGGGWADQPWSCRASVRRASAPDAVLEDAGFRVARGAVGETSGHHAQGWSAAMDRKRADIRGPLPMGWTPLRSLLE